MRDRILAIPPTRQAVSPRYREAIDELTHFLLWHKVTLNEGLDDLADEATLQSVVNAVSPRFRELCSMAESALGEFAPSSEQLAAIRQFTHTNVTTLLADAPVVQRGYSKPFGYPGDYELMSMIYEPTFDGSTPFGRVFHRVFLDDPLAIGGRARCAYMQSILQREYRLWGQRSDDRFRVASLGCGPALVLAHWLQDVSLPAKVDVTLVDQERAALRTAQQACFSAASRGVDLRVACHTLSFVEMLRDLGSLVERGRPHLVYVTGLFDYLKEPVAQRLAASLVRAVGPGGAVVIANAKAPCIGTWCCEFVLDWSLIYRTRSEMEALAQLCGPRVQTTVESGDNSAFHFLVLRTS
jgi:SAM-dependent methyltransferase